MHGEETHGVDRCHVHTEHEQRVLLRELAGRRTQNRRSSSAAETLEDRIQFIRCRVRLGHADINHGILADWTCALQAERVRRFPVRIRDVRAHEDLAGRDRRRLERRHREPRFTYLMA